ncbi:DUF560 domain-containing protein [Sphingomonas populi]|uniref:DUF560 domain-containing protein n=1 Tax=Sphingomonas populi TaxID=2484750 RepID=A0A4Q6XSX3_9SPHN|nr:surface lipoprotein assembly modifier [Sphingomonas populi]RZF60574.1 DUF560 domain-containing protein [Sphingomonas populi]
MLVPAGFASASQAVTQCSEQPCVTGLSAQALFAIAADHLAARRTAEAITILRALAGDPNSDYRAEARFRLAQLYERLGDRAAAIGFYRAILAEKPNANRVRLDLARLLALTGDEAGARRELRTAGAVGLPDDVARVVDQFATALRSRRRVGVTFEVAIAPDSNINASTSRNTIETVIDDLPLSPSAQARSGIGLALSGQGFWRAAFGKQTWLTRLSGRADIYGKRRFHDVSASLASGPEYQLGRIRVRPAALVTRRWYGGELYSKGYGGTLNLLRPINRTAQLELETTIAANAFRVHQQDGTFYDASFALDKAFNSRISGRIGARINRQNASDPGYALTTGGLDLLAARRIGRSTVFAQLNGSRTVADARLQLFREARRDWRLDATAGVLLGRWRFQDLSPVIRVTRSESRSNIGLYDFVRTRIEFALSREF